MCVTMPGRVVSVDGGGADVDFDGRVVRASTRLQPTIRPGDWVMLAAGTIVDRLSATEAIEMRAALTAAFQAAVPDGPGQRRTEP
jgi:hydrogenase assembly chaperone HypC/HupF